MPRATLSGLPEPRRVNQPRGTEELDTPVPRVWPPALQAQTGLGAAPPFQGGLRRTHSYAQQDGLWIAGYQVTRVMPFFSAPGKKWEEILAPVASVLLKVSACACGPGMRRSLSRADSQLCPPGPSQGKGPRSPVLSCSVSPSRSPVGPHRAPY